MSLKPAKKSDLNKSWMQPRRDRRKMVQQNSANVSSETVQMCPVMP